MVHLSYKYIVISLLLVNINVNLFAVPKKPKTQDIPAKNSNDENKKKVIILDIKNIKKHPNYNYLEPSITDSIKKYLKPKFVYKEISTNEWRLIARKNFLFENDIYVPSVGMQLGLLGNVDVVIGGGFEVVDNNIQINIYIIDIAGRNIVKKISILGKTDSTLFKTIEEITVKIAAGASSVLPDNKSWNLNKFLLTRYKHNSVGILSGYMSYSHPGKKSTLETTGNRILPSDLDQRIYLNLLYTRSRFFNIPLFSLFIADYILLNTDLFVKVGYFFGSANLNSRLDSATGNISVQSSGFDILSGLKYNYRVYKKLMISFFTGFGFYHEEIDLSYKNSGLVTLSSEGNSSNADSSLSYNAPVTSVGINFLYPMHKAFDVYISTEYKNVFFANAITGYIILSIGGLYKF